MPSVSGCSVMSNTKICRVNQRVPSEASSTRSHSYDYDVYIFYDLEDESFVREYIIVLLEDNLKCCYELKDFKAGYTYDRCIRTAMSESYWTIVVLSETSVTKGYTNFVCDQSIPDQNLRLLPIIIDDCELPESIKNRVELDFTVMPKDEFSMRLLQSILMATCLLPDPRKPTLKEKKQIGEKKIPPKPQQSIEAPSTDSDITELSSIHSDLVHPIQQFNDDVQGRSKEPEGRSRDERKASMASFQANPKQYINNFNDTDPSSPIFRLYERTLLADILPKQRDVRHVHCVSTASLARLTLCPSLVVKGRALLLLEDRLVRDDLESPKTANGLMETEELLRQSIIGKPFQTETSNFQADRLRTYGRLLFYVAMHIEKCHLTLDLIMMKRVSEVDELATELLKHSKKLSFPVTYALLTVHYAHEYLMKLVTELGNGLAGDKISDRIDELGKVNNFGLFSPWYHLKDALRDGPYWIQLDVILSYVGNLIMKNTEYHHVLLQHLPFLLKPYPTVQLQFCYGVLLNIARILANLVVQHERRDIRMGAMFGVKTPCDCPGLMGILKSHLYKIREFETGLTNIILPLVLTACDLDIRKAIYKEFFVCSSPMSEPVENTTYDRRPKLFTFNEKRMVDLIKEHLTSVYERVGDRLEFQSPAIQHSSAHIIEACLNYTTLVVVKIPRMNGDENMVDPTVISPNDKMLRNEIATLGELRHKNIIKLICGPGTDVAPLHVVAEYLNGGTLQAYLHQGRISWGPVHISQLELLTKCIHIGEALAYLSQQGVVHRDICAHNVLLQYQSPPCEPIVKLAGFSLARRVNRNARLEPALETSEDDPVLLRWSDPESILKGVWSLATDMWMFWCLVYEVFTYGAHPFPECSMAVDVPNMIERGHCLQQPLCVPSDLNLLIQQGLQRNPEQRKTITTFLDSLRNLRLDWSHSCHTERRSLYTIHHGMKYPNFSRDGLAKLSPKEFREKHRRQTIKRTGSGHFNGSVAFKHLLSPDIVDLEEADQPRDCMRYYGGRLVHVNVEVFRKMDEESEMIESLRQLKSDSVCRTLDIENQVNLITELDIGGNAMEALLHNPANYRVEHVVNLMLQVLEGLQHLHTKYHLVHSDLRAQYIYVGAEIPGKGKGYFRAKIGRLGRCKKLYKNALDAEGRTLSTERVPIDSLRWAPIEVIHSPAYYSRGSDIYSVGLVFWQLLYALQAVGELDWRLVVPHPERRLERNEFHRRLMLGHHPEQPTHCPDWAYTVIKMCLRDKFKRPTIDLLLETFVFRKPFQSPLLEGVRHKFANGDHKLYLEQEQDPDAPYLQTHHPEPLGTSEHCCLSAVYDESETYYLRNGRFGDRLEEEDETLLASGEPEEYRTATDNTLPEKILDRCDYKTYDDYVKEQSGNAECDTRQPSPEPVYETVYASGDGYEQPVQREMMPLPGTRPFTNLTKGYYDGSGPTERCNGCTTISVVSASGNTHRYKDESFEGEVHNAKGERGRSSADNLRGGEPNQGLCNTGITPLLRNNPSGRRPFRLARVPEHVNHCVNGAASRERENDFIEQFKKEFEELQKKKMYRSETTPTARTSAYVYEFINDDDIYSNVTMNHMDK